MICPNCKTLCEDYDRFCYHCGAPLSQTPPEKKGSHKIPVLLLTLLSALGIVLFFLIPMGNVPSDTPWFTVQDGTLFFDESLYTGGSELTVPEKVNGQTVTAISDHCFEGNLYLTTVILPDTIEVIGDYAFSGCTGMRGIFLPEGIAEIGSEAFASCSSLEAITVPSSVVSIGSGAFSGCSKLSHIFYTGTFTRWRSLYSSHINLYTHVYCTDGTYLHR